jgi:hypothetical protein
MRKVLALAAASLVAAGLAAPAIASPVCAEEPRAACGGRIFPEPLNSLSFIQHDSGEFEDGIKALARDYPRYVKVRTFSDVLGHKVRSAGGRQIYLIEVTDFDAPESDKVPVAVSLSVHGNERAGLEGGVRYAEDLARWATDDADHELRNGTEKDSIGVAVSDALRHVHLYLTDINPDGWAKGDIANGGVFTRANADGVDLNREFPTLGWTKTSYTPLSESESRSWAPIVEDIAPATASDLHGELTSVNNAFADIMYPAGQWDPREQVQEERLARHMTSNVYRYFEEDGVVVGTVTGAAGMRPADYATAYDVVGYDDSGFMGDFFTQAGGAVEVDVEHFFSHSVPNSIWSGGLEQAHVAAVRGEIETLVVEAMVADDVKVKLDLGKVGYLFDPGVVTDANGYGGPKPPKGVTPDHYRATRMRYFSDLSRYSTSPLRKVTSDEISASELRGLDSFVIADVPFPSAPSGAAADHSRVVTALDDFVRTGGHLVLTDGALKLLGPLGIVPDKALDESIYNAGHIDIDDFTDSYTKGLHTTASQTYYEVPLGYSVDEDSSPHWTVAKAAWEKAGGKSIAHITDESRIGLGRIKLGKGTIAILGALLPTQTEKFDHFFELADYAVTVTGGEILNNILSFAR